MHDPSVVVFDIKGSLPKRSSGGLRHGKRWDFSSPFPTLAGRRFYLPALITVWHEEPEGRDSGTVCKGMGGSDLTWHNVKWAWKHRHHLSVQVQPYLRVRRWLLDRCAECGHRFLWKQAHFGYMGTDDKYHQHCQGYRSFRAQAEERLEVLDLVADVWDVDGRTVQSLARMRGLGLAHEANADNKAWRVFYALDNLRKSRLQEAAQAASDG